MSRAIRFGLIACLLWAFEGCSSQQPGHGNAAVNGNDTPSQPAPHGDPGDNGDPGTTDDPPEQPGDNGGTPDAGSTEAGSTDTGSPDVGSTGDGGTTGASCVAAARGFRSMAAVPTTVTGAKSAYFDDVAWNGHELFTDFRSYDHCTGAGCTPHDEAFAYDPIKDSWRALPPPPGAPMRSYLWGVSLDGKWILFESAIDKVAGSTLDGAIFDPTTNVWTKFAAAPLAPRDDFALVAATTTHELIFWGGNQVSATGGTYADGAAYSLLTGKWRTLPASPLPASSKNIVTWDGARMNVVFPWYGSDGGTPLAVAAAYDPAKDAWTSLPLPATGPRFPLMSVAVPRASADLAATAFFGGFPFNPEEPMPELRDGAWFDPSTSAWTNIPDPGTTLLPEDRTWVASFAANGRLYIWGGQSDVETATGSSSTYHADGLVYDLASGTWSSMVTTGAPSARRGSVTVWTGCDAIFLGGLDASGELTDGARYRP